MSSEQLADGVNPLDAELAATWDILKGYSGRDTDLGIARRFGGSAAAYSLRDIGAMNGRVVKVRRDVDGDGTDKEEDFSANQVSSGALEDWVNGKLESTLPADVDTAAAAYSLRKVKASYSGNAVRIRRSSDDVEVNVAFDSDDKVSASSAISNTTEEGGEIGSTSATDLNGFLNEKLTVGVAVEGGSGGSRPDSFSNATNSSFTATVTDTAGGYFPYKSAAGDAVTVSFDLVLSGGASPSINTSLGVDTVATRAAGTAYSSSGSYTFTLNCNASADHIRFADSDDGTFAVTNFIVTSHTHQGFVHTWYDQAGSNNAVQDTAGNQPKIAESGSLIADGIDFDGSDDFLQTNSGVSITSSSDLSFSTVYKSDVTSTAQSVLSQEDGTGTGRLWLGLRSNNDIASFIGGSEKVLFSGGSSTNETLTSIIFDDSASTLDGFKNSSTGTQGTSVNMEASDGKVNIGEGKSSNERFNGTMKEIIIYLSDQTDNRFKIESNINNYYSLYTFQGNGFVETWYDQSGNGNNVTQGTDSRQPKIVENGSILKEGDNPTMKFDGSDDFLQIGSQVLSNSSSGAVGLYAVVNSTASQAGYVAGSASDDSGGKRGASIYAATTKFVLSNGISASTSSQDNIPITNGSSVLVSACYNNNAANTLQKNSSATGYADGSAAYDFLASSSFTIGHRNRSAGTNPATNLTGTISEVLAFNSDTTSDRDEIQSEIQNYYNL